jgi:(1->4)-alpha-D-glucan 1-alpha-D-glucosylmutase
MIPRATYRLQFHQGFTFDDAARQADYFAALGISHIYASPIQTARKGSRHGYDVVDHAHINPERGGEGAFRRMAAALRGQGLGLIVDIVPNHMAVGGADNRWWLDVLAKGCASPFAAAFDIDWDAPGLEGKLLAPFLDGAPHELWRTGDLRLVKEAALGWAFAYFDHRFPLRPEDQGLEAAPTDWTDLEALLARQHFVLADWREADARINWRRFFDITELAALRVGEPAVFEAVHGKLLALYQEGLIDGFRVDHVDGIADPAAYCRLLHARLCALRPGPYLVVEKILAGNEVLPDWPVQGTTGYDAMNQIDALLHGDDGGALEEVWRAASGRPGFDEEEEIARREMLESKFAAQFEAVVRAFRRLAPERDTLRGELFRLIVALRCYRSYATGKPDSPGSGPILSRALDSAPGLRVWFEDRSGDPAVIDALRRFHQLTAPVAAKAVEDTAFYRYGRLLSRNDVGFDPRCRFLPPRDFHARVRRRAAHFPHAMLATATHDHKRGEDARARLAVLSVKPALWRDFLTAVPEHPPLARADIAFLCQSLIGAWPDEGIGASAGEFAERIEAWCRKYLREAKLRSNWRAPDSAYEAALCAFARALVQDESGAAFRARMAALLGAIRPQADANSLLQVILHLTLPGVPDIYQGREFADFSLVDPDNRRPVDYAARRAALALPLSPQRPFDQRKQALIARLLGARARFSQLWAHGDYAPLAMPDGFIGFERRHGAQWFCVAGRCNGQMASGQLSLPRSGHDLLTGRAFAAGACEASDLFAAWPTIVLFPGGAAP